MYERVLEIKNTCLTPSHCCFHCQCPTCQNRGCLYFSIFQNSEDESQTFDFLRVFFCRLSFAPVLRADFQKSMTRKHKCLYRHVLKRYLRYGNGSVTSPRINARHCTRNAVCSVLQFGAARGALQLRAMQYSFTTFWAP